MEQELFLSGYCKALDRSRMVCVVIENGDITEIDCAYPNCIHRSVCGIAQQVDALTEN